LLVATFCYVVTVPWSMLSLTLLNAVMQIWCIQYTTASNYTVFKTRWSRIVPAHL